MIGTLHTVRWQIPCALLLAASLAGAQVRLEGPETLPVVQSATPAAYDEEAARELAAYLGRVLGREVPVGQGPVAGPAMRVGQAALEAEVITAADLAALNFDGFLVRVSDRGVALCGRNPHGTLYAAYKFLERYAGVRWYMPGELGEVVPRRERLTLPAGDWRCEPRFVAREFAYVDSVPGGDMWARRNGLSWNVPGLPFRSSGSTHNLDQVLKPSQYGATHPEYFPEIGGKRLVPTSDADGNWQPCTSNAEVVDLFSQAAIAYFDQYPREQMFSLGMNDSIRFCECSACRALDPDRPAHYGLHVTSDRYVHFVNAVAQRLREKRPDKFVGFLAYISTEPPPVREKLADNAYVVITQDTPEHHDREYQARDRATVEAWTRAARHVGKYDYYTLSWLLPRYFPHILDREVKWSAERNIQGWFVEAQPVWSLSGPLTWLATQLLWDPTLDVDQLLRQYCTDFFGGASEPMGRYFQTLEQAWEKPRAGRWFAGYGQLDEQFAVITPDVMHLCQPFLEQAARQADSEQAKARVAFFRAGFDLANVFVAENAAVTAAAASVLRSSSAADLRQAAETVTAARAARLALWERLKTDPMQTWYHHECLPPKWSGHNRWLEESRRARETIGLRLIELETGGDPPRYRAALQQELRTATDPDYALALRGRLFLLEPGAATANLLKNPGFDETGGTPAGEVGQDWIIKGMPAGWSAWAQFPTAVRFEWLRRDARSAPACVLMAGTAGATPTADYIQKVPVEGGRSYVGRVYVSARSARDQATMFLWVDLAPGQRVSAVCEVQARTDGWQPLVVTFTTPPEAKQATVFLGMHDFAQGDTVRFDDALLAPLP